MSSKPETTISTAVAQRPGSCAVTNRPVSQGEFCFWVRDIGILSIKATREQLEAAGIASDVLDVLDDARENLPENTPVRPATLTTKAPHQKKAEGFGGFLADGKALLDQLEKPGMDYQAMSEVLACELENALAALTRRGITPDFDTDGLAEYRTAHPRQDS